MSTTVPTAPPLPRSTPEEQGVPSGALRRLVGRWESEGLEPHALVVLRHGRVVAQASWTPFHAQRPGLVYSVSKTFTACAVGFAVDEGLLDLDDRLVDLFPEAAGDAGPRAAALTLHDVLSMRTGHRTDTLEQRGRGVTGFPATFLATEPEEDRGFFVYHNGATLMAALAVQRAAGERLLGYLRPRLLEPLGIEGATWQSSEGLDIGFSGLHVGTDAIARLGELVRCDGVWQDRRVLPEGWVATMTHPHTDTSTHQETVDWAQGYGYQMWRCRHEAVRADGAFGQFSVVVPDAGLVVAVTSCTERTQQTLDAVWDELLPTLAGAPLPAAPPAHDALTAHLASRRLPAPQGSAEPVGNGPWRFTRTPDESHPFLDSLEVRRTGDPDAPWRLTVHDREPLHVPCGRDAWPAVDGPWVARGGWRAPDTFEATVAAVETPHTLTLTGTPDGLTAAWNGVPLGGSCLAWQRAPRA